jgi:FixJ family two-component response regulator
VITDLEMPRAGGREMLEAGLARGVPVVILTAHATGYVLTCLP